MAESLDRLTGGKNCLPGDMLRDLWQRVEQSEARIAELEAARPEILR